VTIDNADIEGSSSALDFGLLNTGGTDVRVRGLRATGFRKAAAAGVRAQSD
jgi:hypothetical protein